MEGRSNARIDRHRSDMNTDKMHGTSHNQQSSNSHHDRQQQNNANNSNNQNYGSQRQFSNQNRRRNHHSSNRTDGNIISHHQHPDSTRMPSNSRDTNNNSDSRNQTPRSGPRFVPGASTIDLPPIETKVDPKRKFTGRCRLFVGNLPHNTSEEKVRELFKPFGEVGEVYLGPKSAFAFIKMDYKHSAEEARNKIDNTMYEGRTIRVRLAAHPSAIKVKNLSPYVTNELLAYAFRYFGEIERAVVITDEKGKSIGEGIVEYFKKPSSLFAVKKCQQENFLLTASMMPVLVEPYNQHDEEEGLPEKSIPMNTTEYNKDREVGPRFAEPNSFEFTFAAKWKELYDLEVQKRRKLEEEFKEARANLEKQVEYYRLSHVEEQLRDQLKQVTENRLELRQINERNVGSFNIQQDNSSQAANRQQDAFNRTPESSSNLQNAIHDLASNQEITPGTSAADLSKNSVQTSGDSDPRLMMSSLGPTQTRSYAEATMMAANQTNYLQPVPTQAQQQMMAMQMYGSYSAPIDPTQVSMMSGYTMPQSQAVYSNPSDQNISETPRENNKYQNTRNNNNYNSSNNRTNAGGRPRKRGRF